MKTARIRGLFILIKAAFITAYYSLLLIIPGYTKRSTRPYVDRQLQAWVNTLLRSAHVHCRVVNTQSTEPAAGRVTIVMSNHSSLYDIPLCFKAFPKHPIRMLAKKELANMPFMGLAMKASEFPFINRQNQSQAIQDLNTAKQLMESGIVMWIFPEGTRSQDGHLARLKKGAFMTALETQATIIPVGIRGAYHILPARTFNLQTHQTAEIHIGKAIDTKDYTLNERQMLIERVYQEIKTLSGETT